MDRSERIVLCQIPLRAADVRLESLLSATDHAQLERFVQPADRARRLLGHAILPLLDIYLEGQVCPECGQEGHGPLQTNPGFASIAHAGQWVWVAVSDFPVGVDVERLPCAKDWARREAKVKCPQATWVEDVDAPAGYVGAIAGASKSKEITVVDGELLLAAYLVEGAAHDE
ncbi:4'-phosphopantetheinyl transferase family protein [Corynebacterium gerontici]|uniref:4'-phosphopantetheinyl transferase n=1 Tax=Corynebacterium gerontici TaxID=2079234 RepID=A0A3G6J313_9CORY|nr:hypothetical protein [Corynebacterium gerontici]AZA12306.1 hypothetical protein CGERO_10105 [Corynebacterium gerontici]